MASDRRRPSKTTRADRLHVSFHIVKSAFVCVPSSIFTRVAVHRRHQTPRLARDPRRSTFLRVKSGNIVQTKAFVAAVWPQSSVLCSHSPRVDSHRMRSPLVVIFKKSAIRRASLLAIIKPSRSAKRSEEESNVHCNTICISTHNQHTMSLLTLQHNCAV